MQEPSGVTYVIHNTSKNAFFFAGKELQYNFLSEYSADIKCGCMSNKISDRYIENAGPEAENKSRQGVERGAGQGSDNYCRNFKKNKYYCSPYTNFLNQNPKKTYINEKGEDYYHEYGESDAG